jgi:hypothetical protein
MEQIEAEAFVGARLLTVGEQRQLILRKKNDEEVNVGDVRGPIGSTPALPPIPDELMWKATDPVWAVTAPPAGDTAPLRVQGGTTVISTNLDGRAAIWFAEPFNGVFTVLAQVGDNASPWYTHINGFSYHAPNTTTVHYGNLTVTVEGYLGHAFHVTICYPGGANQAALSGGQPLDAGRLTCQGLRINWMAIGW